MTWREQQDLRRENDDLRSRCFALSVTLVIVVAACSVAVLVGHSALERCRAECAAAGQ